MVTRDNNDKLVFQHISFQSMIEDMFTTCKTRAEMAFLYEDIQNSIELIVEKVLEEKFINN